jgi:hypothetical protein
MPRAEVLLAWVLVLAVVLRLVIQVNTDVSWLITLDEKVLAGARPYVDFLEVNPPASILLYMPAVMLAHLLHVRPEAVVIVLVFALALASLAFCARLLRGRLEREDLLRLGTVAAFVILVLPCWAFAQREHIALVAMLPMLCIYFLRASGARPALGEAFIAGIGGGLAVIIKPYFALPLFLAELFVLWKGRRLLDLLAPENLQTAVLVLAYAGMVFAFYPEFTHTMLPLVTTLYVPAVVPLSGQIVNGSTLLFVATMALTLLLGNKRLLAPIYAIPLLAACGFMAGTWMQGKGWPYHGYPGIALALMVFGDIVLGARKTFLERVTISFYVVLLVIACAWFQANGERAALRQALIEDAPAHPKILTISGDIGLGHPLTRQLHGSWVGTTGSLWMMPYANFLLARGGLDANQIAKINSYTALERRLLAHDIAVNKPDVVLVAGSGWRGWALSDPGIKAALAAYRPERTVDGVEIWLQRGRRALNAADKVPSSK